MYRFSPIGSERRSQIARSQDHAFSQAVMAAQQLLGSRGARLTRANASSQRRAFSHALMAAPKLTVLGLICLRHKLCSNDRLNSQALPFSQELMAALILIKLGLMQRPDISCISHSYYRRGRVLATIGPYVNSTIYIRFDMQGTHATQAVISFR